MIQAHPFLAVGALAALALLTGYIEGFSPSRKGRIPHLNLIFAWILISLNLICAPRTVGGYWGSLGAALGVAVFAAGAWLIPKYYRKGSK